MYSEYQSQKYPSEGYYYWSSRHINIIQRPLNLKIESVGFVPAVPEHTPIYVNYSWWVSFPGCEIATFWVG